MTITLNDPLYNTFSSTDLRISLEEVKLAAMSSVPKHHNINLSTTKSRGPPPPLPTTSKPKVAVTRSTVEDFLFMESDIRDSIETWLSENLTDTSSPVDSEICHRHRRRVSFRFHTTHSDTNLVAFNRNCQARIAKRRRRHQRSLPMLLHSPDSQPTFVPSSGSTTSGFPFKSYVQRKMKKIFS